MKEQPQKHTPAQQLENEMYARGTGKCKTTLTLSPDEYEMLVFYTKARFGNQVKPSTGAIVILKQALTELIIAAQKNN